MPDFKKSKAHKKQPYDKHSVSKIKAVDTEPTPIDYTKQHQNYDEKMDKVNMKNKQAKAVEEKLANKINLGEESMYTGNPTVDIGIALGRKYAKSEPQRKRKKAERIKSRASKRVDRGGTRAGKAIQVVKGAFKKK